MVSTQVAKREAAKLQTRQSEATAPSQNSRVVVGCLLLAGFGFGVFLLTRRARSTKGEKKAAPTKASDTGLVRYKNTEIREIQWDYEHMVPTKFIITRESLQLP